MFRVGVAALVFVASFHPPVQSQWSQKADRASGMKTAELNRSEALLDGAAKTLTVRAPELGARLARP